MPPSTFAAPISRKSANRWVHFVKAVYRRPQIPESIFVGTLSLTVMLAYKYVGDRYGSVRRYYLNHPDGKHAYHVLVFCLVVVGAGIVFSLRHVMQECAKVGSELLEASLKRS